MNAERLIVHYERIADAPDAIARLRRFVLDLAVRGKLVQQDPKDEPASELLKRIEKEKARLVKTGELRKPRDLDNGSAFKEPFGIPATWRWMRLDAVGAIIGGGTPSATDADNFAAPGKGVPWLTPADLGGYSDLYISRGARDLSKQGLRSSSATVMPKGTILFTSRAPIGYVAIAANPIATNQGFKSIVPYVSDCSRFIAVAMKAFATEIDAQAPGTTFKEVSGKIVAAVPFPLPPLAEQHRIVAKFEELMALCDRLEAARAEREATRDRLTAASLARLNAPDPETFQDDARFALDALPALTTRPDQIKQLRQTILNLAVRGKLVPQDPNDEPASELLKRIKGEKARLLREGKIRDAQSGSKHHEDQRSEDLPRIWKLVTVSDIAYLRSGIALDDGEEQGLGDLPYVKVADLNLPQNATGLTTSTRFVGKNRRDAAIERGSIVFPKRGGAIATNRKRVSHVELVCDSNLMAMKPFLDETRPFLELWFSSFDLWTLNSGTSVPQINNKDIYPLKLPLPPLAEQHRIVAKVDALMALCDRLEASLTASENIRRRLLDALLAEAVKPVESDIDQAA
jgi:type I restriction enzyme, S subunit